MMKPTSKNSRKSSLARRRRGFVSIEWIFVLTLLVLGIVGGLSAVRNAILDELRDICECIHAIEICEPQTEPCQGGTCTGLTP